MGNKIENQDLFVIESSKKATISEEFQINYFKYYFFAILLFPLIPFSLALLFYLRKHKKALQNEDLESLEKYTKKIKFHFKRLIISFIFFIFFLSIFGIINLTFYKNNKKVEELNKQENIPLNLSNNDLQFIEIGRKLMAKEQIYYNKFGTYRPYNSDELLNDPELNFGLDSTINISLQTQINNNEIYVIITTPNGKKFKITKDYNVIPIN